MPTAGDLNPTPRGGQGRRPPAGLGGNRESREVQEGAQEVDISIHGQESN
jgi:hypothetical protein